MMIKYGTIQCQCDIQNIMLIVHIIVIQNLCLLCQVFKFVTSKFLWKKSFIKRSDKQYKSEHEQQNTQYKFIIMDLSTNTTS